MVCKFCGCENLDGSTHCIYCGEPLPGQEGNVGNIMSAFAGVSVDETEAEVPSAEKHSHMTVISAVGRLRRTDIPTQNTVTPEEEEQIREEAQSLLAAAEAEQIELKWNEGNAGIPEAEDLAQEPEMPEENTYEKTAEDADDTAKILAAQAAAIVSRAVEKVMGREENTPAAAPETDTAAVNGPEAAETPAAPDDAADLPGAEPEVVKTLRIPETPENPLNFSMEEIPEKEPEEEPAVHNFVQAAAAAIQTAPRPQRENPENSNSGTVSENASEAEAEAEDSGKQEIDFLPNISLTGTSQIIRESQEEEKQAREEEARRSAYEAAREKKTRTARRRRTHWIWLLLLLLALLGIAYLLWIRPIQQYNRAVDLMQKGNYREALALFSQSGDYKDARTLADECLTHLGIEPTPSSEASVPSGSQQMTEPAETKPIETGTQPAESTPAATIPPASSPEETLPAESTPEEPPVTEPAETTPEETTPEATTPEETTEAPQPIALSVGEIVRYGHYEQDNNAGNGKEEIEWIVLDIQEDHVTLISRYILDQVKFLDKVRWASYSSSGIRLWLTEDFYQAAFSAEEKAGMLEFAVNPGKNPKYNTDQAATVSDEVGLLSVEQVEKYFRSASDKQCTATAYALKRGVYQAANGFSPWWTCTMGKDNESACLVRSDGAINYEGREMTVYVFGARPVIQLSPEVLR